ncbi:MAG TPA: histidine kinase [Blastocatellia bacterium]|jgi:DNA-binding response OmpR family regulator|nr:histidine kinase [Blastocatellia bacterium]HAF21745.1 histidine kinase [Blastocatellia bacterium]HCX28702.1 histidine kinase [Blastocatellia bacterium]
MVSKILVVDDNPELQDLIRSALAHKGYDVLTADDALQGLELIAAEKIDLALLDVMMPGMDGLTMLSQLREHNENLRVIIMSALNTPETAISALRDQACDFLSKPFEMQQLLSAVESALELNPPDTNIEVLSARPEWIELRVPCDPAAIDPLERLMSQLKTDLPRETRDNVIYAFREMLRNAIEYGGKNDPKKCVEVGYIHTPRVIIYRIKDPGEGFLIESLNHAAILNPEGDPLHHQKVRTELGLRPGGFGILIASNLMDEMIYNERHNEVVLIKYLDGDLLKPNHDIPKP